MTQPTNQEDSELSEILDNALWNDEHVKQKVIAWKNKALEHRELEGRVDEISHVEDGCIVAEDEPHTNIEGNFMPISQRKAHLQQQLKNMEEKS